MHERPTYYVLEADNSVREVGDVIEWAKWFEKNMPGNRRVASTKLPGDVNISTVFLGLDHQFGDGPPLLFETMVFEGKDNWSEKLCRRYSTYNEAYVGHWQVVTKVQEFLNERRSLDELYDEEEEYDEI